VLDPFPPRKRNSKRARAVFLRALTTEPGPKRLNAILLAARNGVDLEWFRVIHDIDRDQADAMIRATGAVCGASGQWGFHSTHFEQLASATVNLVRGYLEEHTEQTGMLPNKLGQMLNIGDAPCAALVDHLVATGMLVVVSGHLSVPGHDPGLSGV